ncbi:hypothetical protein FRC02_009547 [Tulasnella sp. 418]|nr:hypothetical protein FRC02_009547 [Tulasnella sp. 418]
MAYYHQHSSSSLPPRFRHKAQWMREQSSSTAASNVSPLDEQLVRAHAAQTASASSSVMDSQTNSHATALTLPSRRLTPDNQTFRYLWFQHEKAKSAYNEASRAIKSYVIDQDARNDLPIRRVTIEQALEDIWVEGPKATATVTDYFKTKRRVDLVERVISEQYFKYLRSQTPSSSESDSTSVAVDEDLRSTPANSVIQLPESDEEKSSPAPEVVSSLPPVIRMSKRLQAKSAAKSSSPAPTVTPATSTKSTKGKKRARDDDNEDTNKPDTAEKPSKRRRSTAATAKSVETPAHASQPNSTASSQRPRLAIKISCEPLAINRMDDFGKPQLSPSFRGKENAFEAIQCVH